MLNPDDLIVGGQAFTEYPEGMSVVEAAFAQRSVMPAREIRLTVFGNRVQEPVRVWCRSAACTPTRSAPCAGRSAVDQGDRLRDTQIRPNSTL